MTFVFILRANTHYMLEPAVVNTVNTLALILQGIVIGILVSAPMGPVGVLTVQRTLNKGRWYGFATGVGAACSDMIYAIITGMGMSFVMDLITDQSTMFILQSVGSILLLLFGISTYRQRPQQNIHTPSGHKGSLWSNAVTGFSITFINPLIIFLFIALFAQLGFVVPDHFFEQTLGYVAIGGGALLWWFVLTLGIEKVRERSDINIIWKLNRFIGIIVIIASVIVLAMALSGISIAPH